MHKKVGHGGGYRPETREEDWYYAMTTYRARRQTDSSRKRPGKARSIKRTVTGQDLQRLQAMVNSRRS